MSGDLPKWVAQTFAAGGMYQAASDPTQSLRPPPAKELSVDQLPLLRMGGPADMSADLAMGPPLGQGGMGVVSLARQNVLQRDVAVKKVLDGGDTRSLLHEAVVMGFVEHPNVVPVHTVGKDADGFPVVVMKRVEGVSWDLVLEDPLAAPATEVVDLEYHVRVLLQLCNAVRYAHSRGVIHRDIKPANVMLGEFGEVYLVDWGIAIGITDGAPKTKYAEQSRKALVGSPAYMAPEMVSEQIGELGELTDVFLLGATLHELITGEPPNEGESPMKAVISALRADAPTYPKGADQELTAIARRAMAKEPEDRFDSVTEFRDALQAYIDHRESVSLTRIAERRVKQIADLVEKRQSLPIETIAETRFALRRALEIWPENRLAEGTRSYLGTVTFRGFLRRGNLPEAARSLRDVSNADERSKLQTELDELREHDEEERRELDELRRDNDASVDVGARLWLGVTIAVLWAALALYKGVQRLGVPLEDVEPNYALSLVPTIGVPAILAFLFRRLYWSNAFNRRMFLFFLGGLVSVAFLRIAGLRYDLAAHITTSMEFLVYSLIAFVFGVFTDFRISVASGAIFAATIFALIFPGHQYLFMFIAWLIFAPYVAFLWLRASD